jgi:hypothetical protein
LFTGLLQGVETVEHDRQDGVGRAAVGDLPAEMFQGATVAVFDQAAGEGGGGGHGVSSVFAG